MSTVAIYARHSSDKQTTSTHDQVARCEKFCLAKGYDVSDIFTDEAISGSTPIHNRPGIHDLIEAAIQGNFTNIITEDLSRLSRDQGDIAHFYKKMQFLDINIETVSEGDISELHIGLKGTMNALFLKDLADKTKRGMIASALKGSVPGGKAYGYDIVKEIKDGAFITGQRSINEEQAENIKKIFELYLSGSTLHQICHYLNAQDIPSPSGKKWLSSVLCGTLSRQTGILRQTLYKGLITFNRMAYKKHPITGNRTSVMRPENEWVHVPIPELAIISEKTFEKVQKEIQRRSTRHVKKEISATVRTVVEQKEDNRDYMRQWRSRQYRPNKLQPYLTTRRLWCTHCDEKIVTYSSQKERCKNRECKHHTCLKRQEILPEILLTLKKFNPNDLLPFNAIPKGELEADQSRLVDLLRDKRIQVRTLLINLSNAKKGTEAIQYLETLEKECMRLNIDLKKVTDQLKELAPLSSEEQINIVKGFHQKIKKYEHSPLNYSYVKAVQSFIQRINVSNAKQFNIGYDLMAIVKTLR